MNEYVTGSLIKELRERNKMTQLQLAQKIGVSDKTISKWETAKGYPDITLLEPIADAFSVSVAELLSGNTIFNANISANMMRVLCLPSMWEYDSQCRRGCGSLPWGIIKPSASGRNR